MKITPLYRCEACGKSYHTVREAVVCENGHKMGNMRCNCGCTLVVVRMVDQLGVVVCSNCGKRLYTFLR